MYTDIITDTPVNPQYQKSIASIIVDDRIKKNDLNGHVQEKNDILYLYVVTLNYKNKLNLYQNPQSQ